MINYRVCNFFLGTVNTHQTVDDDGGCVSEHWTLGMHCVTEHVPELWGDWTDHQGLNGGISEETFKAADSREH